MERPPKKPGEPILTGGMLIKAYLFLGPIAAAIGLFGFFYAYWQVGWQWADWSGMAAFGQMPIGSSPATGIYMVATTMTLTGIVMAQVGNGFAMRTHRQSIISVGFFTNKLRWWGLGAELAGIAALMYVPALQRIFSTAPLTLHQWLILSLFAPVLLIADEIRKFFLRRFWKNPELHTGHVLQVAPDQLKAR
jgi:Ca2+-transporting ATPase